MILDKKETTVAYRCPACGAGVMSLIGAFTLSADMIRLKCPCGESEMTVTYQKDKRVRLSVPCLFCATPHSYTLMDNLFFGKELFTFGCAYTGLDICFVGSSGAVGAALEESERELLELLGGADTEALYRLRSQQNLTDPQVYDIVNFVVKDLEEEGRIHCRCQDGEGEYGVEIAEESIRVVCSSCGALAEYPANSITAAQAFLDSEELYLT